MVYLSVLLQNPESMHKCREAKILVNYTKKNPFSGEWSIKRVFKQNIVSNQLSKL